MGAFQEGLAYKLKQISSPLVIDLISEQVFLHCETLGNGRPKSLSHPQPCRSSLSYFAGSLACKIRGVAYSGCDTL